jgi:hypothetical protein
VGVSFAPFEANSPLVIDPYAVLSFPVPTQGFKSIPRRNTQILVLNGCIQHGQFSARDAFYALETSAAGT